MSLSRPDCEGTRFALLPEQQQQQQRPNNVGASTRVSEQQLYSRLVFYGRFMNAALPFRTGDPPGYPPRAKIERRRKRKGEGGRKREENGCSAARIFTRKGVSVIYWKSLPRSCGCRLFPEKRLANLTYRREWRVLLIWKLNLFASLCLCDTWLINIPVMHKSDHAIYFANGRYVKCISE